MRVLSILLFLFIANNIKAQNPVFDWGYYVDGDIRNTTSVVSDSLGNVYLAGTFQGALDCDPSAATDFIYSSTPLTFSHFIIKLNSNGNLIWKKQIDGSIQCTATACPNDDLWDMKISENGYLYLSGTYAGQIDFDPGPGIHIQNALNVGIYDFSSFILKLDLNGNFINAKSLTKVWGKSFAIDKNNNFFLTGTFQGVKDLDPGPGVFQLGSNVAIPLYSWRAFILKLDSSESFVWAKEMGMDSSGTIINYISVDKNSNIYTTGAFNTDSIDLDPGLGTSFKKNIKAGRSNIFIQKLDANGDLKWGHVYGDTTTSVFIGATSSNGGKIIESDDMGNVYATGYFDRTLFKNGFPTYDTLLKPSFGSRHKYIVKHDSLGNVIWSKKSVSGGYSNGSIDLDKKEIGLVTSNNEFLIAGYQSLLESYDTSSAQNWALQWPLTPFIFLNTSYGHDVTFKNDSYFFSGRGEGIVDLNPTNDTFLTTYSNTPGFVVKMRNCERTNRLILDTVCNTYMYTSLNGTFTFNNSGIYYDTLVNANGCDSIVKLDLTIIPSTSATLNIFTCDSSYQSPSGSHFWNTSGMYTDTIPNVQGCDSILSINLNVGQDSYDTVNVYGCPNYLSPSGNHMWSTNGTYLDTIPNSSGCDSLITINLTTINLDTTISITANSLTSNETNSNYQWFECGTNQIIFGATGQTYIPQSGGSYYVVLNSNDCIDTSSCKYFEPLGIDEYNLINFRIYPNPFADEINISSDLNLDFKIKIHSLLGQEIFSKNYFQTNKANIKLQKYADGVYFLSVEEKGIKRVVKIIKK